VGRIGTNCKKKFKKKSVLRTLKKNLGPALLSAPPV
jgi:hypothetical protein